MESENSQYLSPTPCTSSLPPPQNSVEWFIGSFVTLISNYGLRYQGVLYYLNLQDSTLGLQNVICYGTEGRMKNTGFQIPPCSTVYYYIVFSGLDIKEIIVKPPSSFTCCALPLHLYNPLGAKISQKIPLISNEKLNKPQATQPWSDHVHQSMPYGALNQDPIKALTSSNLHDSSVSDLTLGESFFITFPPAPVSIPPTNGAFDFEGSTKNFKQYELWDRPKNKEEELFDLIGSSCNPFGPIARPMKHIKVPTSNNLQRRPSNFRGGYNTPLLPVNLCFRS